MGAVVLGGTTSLSGIVTSVTAAANGHAELALSNAIGGIAAQTAFLAIADMAYHKANLEHAAASEANLLQGTLLVALLAIPLLAMTGPAMSFFSIHPATLFMFVAYGFGLRLVSQAYQQPMWRPRLTPETAVDKPEHSRVTPRGLTVLWMRFALLAVLVGLAGWLIAQAGVAIAQQGGLSETAVGSVLTAVSTSLPELTVAVSAVRRGALTLAVSDIIGGNAYDTLFLACSDIAYRNGSIYHAASQQQIFLLALSILLTSILLTGLLRREKHGIANIGFESVLILLLYFGSMLILFFGI
jgi:cation:H+ antiporter